MKKENFIFIICVFIALFFSCRPSISTLSTEDILSADQLRKIDSIGQAFIDKGNTAGLSMGISYKGDVIFSKGYGLANVSDGRHCSDSTIYAIASVSKFLTALTTLILVEKGALKIEDKVIDHISAFPRQEYMDEITIEHLLRHQSGLVDHEHWFDSIYINEKRVFTDQELYDFLDQPLFFRPGTHFSYSNSGFAILSTILEEIEKKSFHDLIQDNLGRALGAESLGLWPLQWDDYKATMGYELTKEGLDTSFHMMTKGMKGGGGLSASVLDLLKIVDNLVKGNLISDASLDILFTPSQLENISVDYGLGTRLGNYGNQKTFGHSGGYQGIGWAMVAHYPESGFTFAGAMNTSYSPQEIWGLRSQVMPIVLELSPPEAMALSLEEMKKYVGEYQAINRWGYEKPSTRIVYEKNGKLYRDDPDTETLGSEIYQIRKNVFSYKPYPYDEFKFHEIDGKIVACSEYYDGFFVNYRLKID